MHNKKHYRLMPVIIAAALVAGPLTGASVAAPSSAEQIMAYEADEEKVQILFDIIRTALDVWDGTDEYVVDVSKAEMMPYDLTGLYDRFIEENPQYFFLNGWEYSVAVVSVDTLRCSMNTDYTPADFGQYMKKTGEILNTMNGLYNEAQKALFLHDWMVVNLVHDEDLSFSNAYTTLINKCGTSYGYAALYRDLLKRSGVDCSIIQQKKGGRAWNLICADGGYYFVDCASDDTDSTLLSECLHSNFMRDNAGMQETGHGLPSTWTDSSGNPIQVKIAEEPEDAFWAKTTSVIGHDGHTVYYLDDETGTAYQYDFEKDQAASITYDGDIWDVDISGGTSGLTFNSTVQYGDLTYQASSDTIYVIDKDGNKTPIYKLTEEELGHGSICALRVEWPYLEYDLKRAGSTEAGYTGMILLDGQDGSGSDQEGQTDSEMLSIIPEELSLEVGERALLTVTGSAIVGKTGYTFSVDDPSVAEVSQSGVVKADPGHRNHTAAWFRDRDGQHG